LRKFVVVLLSSIVILIVVLAVVRREPKVKEPVAPLVAGLRSQVTSEDLRQNIDETDAALENMIGEGTDYFTVEPYATASWDEFIDDPLFSEDRLDRLDGHVDVYGYHEDIGRFRQLIAIAKRERDVTALVYAYRIISDLNDWLFNPDDKKRKYWEATESLQWHASQTTITKIKNYIDDHG